MFLSPLRRHFKFHGIHVRCFLAVFTSCLLVWFVCVFLPSDAGNILRLRLTETALQRRILALDAFHTVNNSSFKTLFVKPEVFTSTAFKRHWVGFPDLEHVNCSQAFSPDAKNDQFPKAVRRFTPGQLFNDSLDCERFLDVYGFNRYPDVSKEEMNFLLAFSILFHKDIDQVLFLLRAVYRPDNVYCLALDANAEPQLYTAVNSLVKCIPNVFLSSRLERVVYAGFSRLQADINCMSDLLQHPVTWRYVINMPGQQFPLRTNLELVRIIKTFKGRNDVEGKTHLKREERYMKKHFLERDNTTGVIKVRESGVKNSDPPHGLTIIKGSAYSSLTREFVQFALSSKVAGDLLSWLRHAHSPDEYFWATLHYAKHIDVPGGYKGEPSDIPWLTSFAKWSDEFTCRSLHVRGICILSTEDLHDLLGLDALTVNKFYISNSPAALHCLDVFLYNLSVSGTTRDLSYYHYLRKGIRPTDDNKDIALRGP